MHERAFRPFPCEPRTGCSAGWDTADNQCCLVSCEPLPRKSGTCSVTPRNSLHWIPSLSQHTVLLSFSFGFKWVKLFFRCKSKKKKKKVFTAVTYSVYPKAQPCTEDREAHLLHTRLCCCGAPAKCSKGREAEGRRRWKH